MYQWIRNTHLFLGLFAGVFLLTYAASGVQMAHNAWFTTKPTLIECTLSLPAGNEDARDVARVLMDEHGLDGELRDVKKADGGYTFRIARVGTAHQVEYSKQTGEAKIRTNVATFMGMLNRVHHVHGLWHETLRMKVWGVLVGLVSAALILSGLTGIYLWFKIHNERVIGAILLAVSLSFSLTLIILMRN